MRETGLADCNRPEEEILLCCARARLDAPGREQLQSLLRAGVDWDRLLRLAKRHSLHLLLYQCLQSVPIPVAARERVDALQTRFHVGVMWNETLTRELLGLLALFDSQGITVIPYKGPALAAVAYEDPVLRPCGDLDFLIRSTDLPRAGEVLRARGYQSQQRFGSAAEEAAHLQADCELNFLRPQDKLLVELHWRFRPQSFPFSLDMEALWERRQTSLLACVTVPSLPWEDWLIILCVHGAKHRWERLIWVCDIAGLIRARPEIAWELVTEQAERLGCVRVLLLGLLLARDLLDAPVPEALLEGIPPVVMSLAAQVRRQIAEDQSGFSTLFAHSVFHWSVRERLRDRLPYVQDRLRREARQRRTGKPRG